jgi:hypothetical protein
LENFISNILQRMKISAPQRKQLAQGRRKIGINENVCNYLENFLFFFFSFDFFFVA